jgi:hypothetical protein
MDRYGFPSPRLRADKDRVLLWFAMVGDLPLDEDLERLEDEALVMG